jgi:manganese transport protein
MVDVESGALPEARGSVRVPPAGRWFRRYLAVAGPGFLVSVGYMDPGNWATDLEGGSRYGYALLWVVLASNLMAILLQTLAARLGLVTGKDLARACRDYVHPRAAVALWLLCEVAIIACDLAEVIGSAVALQLLFGLPLVAGVVLTGLDVLLLLALGRFGFRKLEAIVTTLVATVALCFAYEMVGARPDWQAVGLGLARPTLPDREALLISLGILGATVMPHNLYLHSAVVQTRAWERTSEGTRSAIRWNTLDTVVSLGAAFFVNAAILVLAGAVFHGTAAPVDELGKAHELLRPTLGAAAATAFAVALLASGQSSTITGTLAGQIVMEGFLRVRIAPHVRRLATRLLAMVPALAIVLATGGKETARMLTWSQVVLSMQLSFAVFPLVAFTSDRKRMGEFANPAWLKWLAYAVGTLIAGLNVQLLRDTLGDAVVVALAAAVGGFAWWTARSPAKAQPVEPS